ncbi:hypothetical protein EK904_008017, partial [Melospiza melodia maxima]
MCLKNSLKIQLSDQECADYVVKRGHPSSTGRQDEGNEYENLPQSEASAEGVLEQINKMYNNKHQASETVEEEVGWVEREWEKKAFSRASAEIKSGIPATRPFLVVWKDLHEAQCFSHRGKCTDNPTITFIIKLIILLQGRGNKEEKKIPVMYHFFSMTRAVKDRFQSEFLIASWGRSVIICQ